MRLTGAFDTGVEIGAAATSRTAHGVQLAELPAGRLMGLQMRSSLSCPAPYPVQLNISLINDSSERLFAKCLPKIVTSHGGGAQKRPYLRPVNAATL